ncbi:MAG: chemotaxis protein CheW [Clostridia bacterium]|nr:chemotaxis protein CheW [Clostridia bacterium]
MADLAEYNDQNFYDSLTTTVDGEEVTIPTKKFLAFQSDELQYAIDADYVSEIIIPNSITKIPKLPEFISGIINLRGQLVPILDIRLRMGRSKTVFTDDTCIIIMKVDDIQLGILVDSVSQMIDIPEPNISALPLSKHQELVNGIIRIHDMVLLIISIEDLLKKNF